MTTNVFMRSACHLQITCPCNNTKPLKTEKKTPTKNALNICFIMYCILDSNENMNNSDMSFKMDFKAMCFYFLLFNYTSKPVQYSLA